METDSFVRQISHAMLSGIVLSLHSSNALTGTKATVGSCDVLPVIVVAIGVFSTHVRIVEEVLSDFGVFVVNFGNGIVF